MIVVTGATSKVGRALVWELRARGADFQALVRSEAKAGLELGADVPLVRGDLNDAAALERAVRGAEALLLLSPVSPEMVRQQLAAVQAARSAGVGRLVKMSGLGAGVHATSLPMRQHGEVEAAVRRLGVPATFLHANLLTQSLLMFAPAARRFGRLPVPFRRAGVSVVNARDVASVAAEALLDGRHAGRAYDLTGPEALTGQTLAERFSEGLGRRVQPVEVPRFALGLALRASGRDGWAAAALTGLFGSLARGEGSEVTADIAAVTGRQPRTLRTFMREHAGECTTG